MGSGGGGRKAEQRGAGEKVLGREMETTKESRGREERRGRGIGERGGSVCVSVYVFSVMAGKF